jgi:hypothetical protein
MLRGSHTHHCDVVGTSSCDTLVLRFVFWDQLVEYEVYEGLAPIILFLGHQHVGGGAEVWSC